MSDLNTPDYYRRREQQELDLADKAISPVIADIHLRMADKYSALAGEAETPPARPILKIATPR